MFLKTFDVWINKYFQNLNIDNENSEMSVYSLNFFSTIETWISNKIDLKINGYVYRAYSI